MFSFLTSRTSAQTEFGLSAPFWFSSLAYSTASLPRFFAHRVSWQAGIQSMSRETTADIEQRIDKARKSLEQQRNRPPAARSPEDGQ